MFKEFIDIANAKSKDDLEFFLLEIPLRDLVVKSPFVQDSINKQLGRILKQPNLRAREWSPRGFEVAHSENWVLKICLPPAHSEFLYTEPCNSIMVNACDVPMHYTRHYVNGDGGDMTLDSDVFDPDVQLEAMFPERATYGSTCFIDSRRDVIDFQPETQPAVLLVLSGRQRRSIRWAFSRQTLRAVQPVLAHPAYSELVSMIRAIAAIGNPDSVPVLASLADHPQHFVRWTALQALLRLNPEVARAGFHRAAHDEHPHIRKASERALAAMAE